MTDAPDLDKMVEKAHLEHRIPGYPTVEMTKEELRAFAAKVDAKARLEEAVNIAPNCAAGRHQECDICRHIAQLKKLT